jgi:hypothetical protein
MPCFSLLPRTALAAMLRGNFEEGWLSHFGLKCSSNVAVNAGTSGRSVCCAIGNTEYKSVRDSNCLGSRIFECITNDYKHVFLTYWSWFTAYLVFALICFTNQKFKGVPIHCPRTILLMMVAVCLNACIVLEQPFSSFFEYYPRWRDFMQMLHHHGGLGTVARLNTHSPKFQPRCNPQP